MIIVQLVLILVTLTGPRGGLITPPKYIYFPGGGIYYYWQAGAAKYIRQNWDLSSSTVLGASAGALTSTLLVSDVDFDQATRCAIRLALQYKIYDGKLGLAGIWGNLIRLWLNELIDENVDIKSFANLGISISYVTPLISTKLVTDFYSRQDVIDACMASCHIPFFLDGRPFTVFRNTPAIDGSLRSMITRSRSGMPLPDSKGSAPIVPEDIIYIDYSDDKDFLSSTASNFVELITPDGAWKMMEAGYDFMRRKFD